MGFILLRQTGHKSLDRGRAESRELEWMPAQGGHDWAGGHDGVDGCDGFRGQDGGGDGHDWAGEIFLFFCRQLEIFIVIYCQ